MQSSKEKVDISSQICVAIQKSSCSGYENAHLQSVQGSCGSDISNSKNQNHFNGWILFDRKINLMLAHSKIQQKKSRKLCYMEFIKIEINGFERQPLFDIKKVYVKKQWKRSQVRLVMEKFKKQEKSAKNYKHWTLNCRNSKVVWNIPILFCVKFSNFDLVFAV